MSTTTYPEDDPRLEFDSADRMRRALRVSKTGVAEMAQYLDVDRTTVGNWINGRAKPRPRDLRGFAARTGFPVDWLAKGVYPERDSNSQPTDYNPASRRPKPKSGPRSRRSGPPARRDGSRPHVLSH